ncbi:MAG: hypothetical protein ABEK59_03005 [Halobacteria archaeon]
MQDRYKELMFRSFKDAMDIVHDYNEWSEESFDDEIQVHGQTVSEIAMLLYRSRAMEAMASSGDISYPNFEDKMFE